MLKKYVYLVITLLFVSIGCSDFIEEDIEEDILVLLGPADGVETETQVLTFWWNYLDGASAYRLQIVSPNFENMVSLELDTLITGNSFLDTLYPGNFEWRVRAENSAYYTEYTSSSLIILEDENTSEDATVWVSPIGNTMVKNTNLAFTRDQIRNKDSFHISGSVINLEVEEGKYSGDLKANDITGMQPTPYSDWILSVANKIGTGIDCKSVISITVL